MEASPRETDMIKRPHFILQLNVDDKWHALQTFDDAERAATALADARAEDTDEDYRIDDRSYEIPDPFEAPTGDR
jgi:hypothetical protein